MAKGRCVAQMSTKLEFKQFKLGCAHNLVGETNKQF